MEKQTTFPHPKVITVRSVSDSDKVVFAFGAGMFAATLGADMWLAFFVCALGYWVSHLEQKVRKYESRTKH